MFLPARGDKHSAVFFLTAVCRKLFLVGKGGIIGLVAVLDATPIIFRTVANLGGVGEKAVHIAAVGAIDFIEKRKIAELFPVKIDVAPQLHALNPIQPERHRLIDEYTKVHRYDRQRHPPNKGY